jgi:uncharacterized protein YjeT (DUF2065 family)
VPPRSLQTRPITPRALGVFFALASCITLLVGLSFVFPGGWLDIIWRIKPDEHLRLKGYGQIVAWGFLLISTIMAAASIGCFARQRWGWTLAVTIFFANGAGDATRIFFGAPAEGLLGVSISDLVADTAARSQAF